MPLRASRPVVTREEQEWDVIACDVHVALVDFGGPGHGVEIFNLRPVGVVLDDAVGVFVGDAEDFVEWFAVGVFDDGEVELAAADEIDDFALVEGAVGVCGDWWANEGDFDGGVRVPDGPGEAMVAAPAYGGGEEYEEVVTLGDFNGLVRGDVVWRGRGRRPALGHANRGGGSGRVTSA